MHWLAAGFKIYLYEKLGKFTEKLDFFLFSDKHAYFVTHIQFWYFGHPIKEGIDAL